MISSFLVKFAQAAVDDTTIVNEANKFGEGGATPLDQAGILGIVNTFMSVWLWLVGILAFLCILYSAYLFMTSGLDEDNAKKAKKFLLYGIIGSIVLILSLSIVSFSGSLIGK